MSRLVFDAVGERKFRTGVSKAVLYPYDSTNAEKPYSPGVAWNGVTKISDNPEGAEANDNYADNILYLTIRGVEKFKASVEAFTYPDEFAECDGSKEVVPGMRVGQQNRKTFGLCYRTELGNDTDMLDYGYELNLVYGCTTSPSSKDNTTINENPELASMSWEITGAPVAVTGFKPTSKVTLNSVELGQAAMTAIENALYGTAETDAYLPTPDEIKTIITNANANG